MPRVKKAQTIRVFLCDHCAAVHIGLYRNGQMFAEAIPHEIEELAADLASAIAESKARRAAASTRLQ